MNTLRNKVQLIGNLGQTPEIIKTENGNKVANFSMATSESFKNSNGEKQTDTQWHNIVAWGKLADIIENHVKKGDEIALEGKLVNSNYKAKDGTMRYVTKVQVSEILMLTSKPS
jgi:single-strand DNA-binding protein